MTDREEFNAATVDEALKKASDRMGFPVEKLSYEVLDTGSPGFLGIGARDARIAVVSDERNHPEAPIDTVAAPSVKEADTVLTSTAGDYAGARDAGAREGNDVTAETLPVAKELLDDVEQLASYVVDAMGFDAHVSAYDAGEFIAVDVNTPETGLFIGQKGETIDALQYLLNVSIFKDRPFIKRIIVDSEGYRQRRIEAVQGIAHRMARKAVRETRSVELPPMNSAERRVVHLFLRDNPAVSTLSEGSGENRRVTISPIP